MNNLSLILKSFAIFIILMVTNFMLGNLNAQTIALLVFFFAAVIFSAAFISAVLKDRVQKRKTSQRTVFES